MKKGLLLLNMSHRFDWQSGIVNRNFHVLQELQKSNTFDCILSVDFLPFTAKKHLKVLLQGKPWKKNSQTVFRQWNMRVDRDEKHPNVYHMVSTNLHQLSQVFRAIEFPSTDMTVWSYDPFTAPYFSLFPEATIVFDAVDNWIEHPSYERKREELQQCYKEIKKRADVIFTVSQGLVDFFDKKQNVYYVPNGVDPYHFRGKTCPIADIPHPIVGYHGIIQSRVNFSVFEYLAEKRPQTHFVIAGPVWKESESGMRSLREKKNVHFLGAVSYQDLPSIISCFDVAIVPHRVDHFTQSMNPLKLYEYLAAGKPIVSSPVAGSEQFQDLVHLAVSPEDFLQHIERALMENSDTLRQRRQSMAEAYSWERRVQTMLESIAKIQSEKEKDVA